MRLAADLHIHSRHSIATSPKLTPPYLDRWARVKGLDILGTGDCTHPAWLAELREALEPAADGFYRLKPDLRRAFDAGPARAEDLPTPGRDREVRFVPTGEISTIYSRDGRTRKVHHLVLLPDFEAAARFQARLSRVGNVASDGRPILGIDSRDLLELLLDADPRAVLVPAHVWTPWFSALGEKSGFDSIEECYRDLADRITAIETGLSSNPPMNWAVSALDRFAVVSNSDAHSPEKLGREATILESEPSWEGLTRALAGGGPGGRILETVEFYPQEGKYHADGHRSCGVVRIPGDGPPGPCPACGKPLTPGVLGRVAALADRPLDESAPCPEDFRGTNRRPYRSRIPLKEILSELTGTGEGSRAVSAAYAYLVREAGSELDLLLEEDPARIGPLRAPGIPGELLAEALVRMREGRVRIRPGYDGEYGEVRLFAPGERFEVRGEAGLFEPGSPPPGAPGLDTRIASKGAAGAAGGGPSTTDTAGTVRTRRRSTRRSRSPDGAGDRDAETASAPPDGDPVPDPEQEAAVGHPGGPALVLAGPGTGKTSVLIRRIARILEGGTDPASILALTFTNKAARELRDRLERIPGSRPARGVTAATFHAFCLGLLRERAGEAGLPPGFRVLGREERDVLLAGVAGRRGRALGAYVESRKRRLLLPGERSPRLGPGAPAGLSAVLDSPDAAGDPGFDPNLDAAYAEYRARLRAEGALDFDDLPSGAVRLLAARPGILESLRGRYRRVFVDEYQDVNPAQYALVRLLAPPELLAAPDGDGPDGDRELFVIGDPDQSIYSFRGADPRFIARFREDYPSLRIYSLFRSWRCPPAILGAAGRLAGRVLEGSGIAAVLERREAPTDRSEAEGIAREIDRMIGGTRFFALDSGTAGGTAESDGPGLRSLADCAVLVRASAQFPALEKALRDHGLPYRTAGGEPWWEREPDRSALEALRSASRPGEGEPGLRDLPGGNPREAVRAAGGSDRLAEFAAAFGSLPALLDALALGEAGEADPARRGSDPRDEAVRLLTVHAAKGLEFDHVFVAGLEEGLFPFTLYEETAAGPALEARIEEERRLLYVALTRARRGLFLWRARERTFRGRRLALPPSRFLAEIEDLVPAAGEDRSYRRDPQGTLFPSNPEARK